MKSTSVLLVSVLYLSLLVPLTSFAQYPRPAEDLLVRNVTLLDPSGNTEGRLVNILIKNNKLEIITEDKIPAEEADQVLDGDGGFVVGKLDVGSSPSFMILSTDPREDFRVMLDTKSYAVFALHDGQIVKNRLLWEFEENGEEEPKPSGWLAYTPPPFALPLDYQDSTKWNRWDTKNVSGIFVSALVLDRMNWLSQDAISEGQVGDLDDFSGGEIRGFRIGALGTLNYFEKPWVWAIFGATHAWDKGFDQEDSDKFTLFDWRLDIPFFKNSVMSIGKQKEPISGERIQSMAYNQMQERSAVSDALLPARNVGVVWNGISPRTNASWAFGAFNDWFDQGLDYSESATQYVGRVAWAPRSKDESNLLHLGLGYRYSDAKEGFRALTEPEFNKSPVFVDTGIGTETGVLQADKIETWNAELSWRRGPFWLASEYTQSNVSNPSLGDPSLKGYFVSASYALTGEMRPYRVKGGTFGALPISRNVNQGGIGSWEISSRWSHTDLEDGLVTGGEMDIASLGLTWWASPFLGLNINYRYIWNTREGEQGESSGINTRVMLVLE